MIPGPAMLVSLYQLVRKVPRKDYYKCLINVEEFLKSSFQIIFISF